MDPDVVNHPMLDELRWIDSELIRVDRARNWLVRRRMELLAEMTVTPPSLPQPTLPPPAQPDRAEPASAGTELSRRAVARLLLVVGAALVVIAAAAFTVANWSSIGPLGRALVLLGATGVMLTAPVPLARRGLRATAESIAAIGLALTIGDAYLVGRLLNLGGGDRLLGVAAATAALTAAWFGYGRATRLRVPLFAAIGMAQLPGLYLTAWLAGPLTLVSPLAFALVVTAGADALAAMFALRHVPTVEEDAAAEHSAKERTARERTARERTARERTARERTAEAKAMSLMAAMTWLAGVTLALIGAVTVPTLPVGCWLAGTMAVAAIVGIGLWPRAAGPASSEAPVAIASGFLLTSIALPVAVVLPTGWPVAAFAAAAFGIAAFALALRRASAIKKARLPMELVAAGAGAALALAGLAVVPGALLAVGTEAGWPALVVLVLLGLACWRAPVALGGARCAAIVVAALAISSLPTAVDATGVARLAILTAGAAALALWAARRRQDAGRALPGTAVVAATALGTSAMLWSLAAMTVPEVAALAAVFAIAAALAINDVTAAVATGAALASATGLAFAPGWPVGQSALAATAIAVLALAAATLLRRLRPVQALVLDLGAGPVVVLAAVVAAGRPDTFSVVTVTAAVVASTTSWLRSGARRTVATWAAGCSVLAAVGAQWRPLTMTWSAASLPWHGHPLIGLGTAAGIAAGLPFAVGVLAVGLAALVTAAGALRGTGRGSLDALAIALPIVAGPALVASGLGYGLALACLLALALVLTGWAAFGGIASAGGAIVATGMALVWALAAPTPTLIVLVCLAGAYLGCAVAFSRARTVMACLSVLAFESAWCVWLATQGVSAIEPYTLPIAAALIAFGWHISRGRLSSWISFGPGLALLLGPSLAATWQGHGWIRPTALGLGATAVTLLGARAKLQAPLLIGATVALIDAGYQLAPTVRTLTEAMPGWVPIAVIGTALLWTGATYEARLRNLTSLRRALADLR